MTAQARLTQPFPRISGQEDGNSMMKEQKKKAFIKPLLIAVGCDVLTFGCFAAFYGLPDGKSIWLAAGLLFAFASFPFYRRTLLLLRDKGK